MTLLECLTARFGEIDAETKVKSTGSYCKDEYVTETIVVDQGPRRPPIMITIRKHVST